MVIAITINKSWNIYNFRKGLVMALMEAGHDIVAIAPRDGYSSKLEEWGCAFENLPMTSTGSNPFSEFDLILKMRRILLKHKVDILLSYTIKCNVYGTFAARMVGIPIVCNITGLGTAFLERGLVNSVAKRLYRVAFRWADHVFLQNPDDRRLFLNEVSVRESKTSLLPGSGINLSDFKFKVLPEGDNVFLMVSRLLIDKGVNEYLEAAKIIRNKYSRVTFRLIGGHDQDHRRSVDLEKVLKYQKDGVIEYFDHSDEIPGEIEKAHVVVLPSYREGTPRTLLEGGAIGRPLITTDVPGCREVLEDGRNGFLCEARNPDSLAEAFEKFILLPKDQQERMSRESRQYMEAKFDERIIIQNYLSRVKELAG